MNSKTIEKKDERKVTALTPKAHRVVAVLSAMNGGSMGDVASELILSAAKTRPELKNLPELKD